VTGAMVGNKGRGALRTDNSGLEVQRGSLTSIRAGRGCGQEVGAQGWALCGVSCTVDPYVSE
jgi:hypothetical protein